MMKGAVGFVAVFRSVYCSVVRSPALCFCSPLPVCSSQRLWLLTEPVDLTYVMATRQPTYLRLVLPPPGRSTLLGSLVCSLPSNSPGQAVPDACGGRILHRGQRDGGHGEGGAGDRQGWRRGEHRRRHVFPSARIISSLLSAVGVGVGWGVFPLLSRFFRFRVQDTCCGCHLRIRSHTVSSRPYFSSLVHRRQSLGKEFLLDGTF